MIFQVDWRPNESSERVFLDFLLGIWSVEMVIMHCGGGALISFKKKSNYNFYFSLVKIVIFRLNWRPNESNEGVFLEFLLGIWNVEMIIMHHRGGALISFYKNQT